MKEVDIRSAEIHARYLEMSVRDSQKMDRGKFVPVACPACKSNKSRFKFSKNRFDYVQCDDCGSLYCSPRPSNEELDHFYKDAESSIFWAKVFFPAVAESRRNMLFKKKATQIRDLFSRESFAGPSSICDVGAGYGIFLEELGKAFPTAKLHAVEPGHELAEECRKRGINTLEAFVEKALAWNGRFDFVMSSEVIEHLFSPEKFVKSLYDLTKPGGHAIVTGLGCEGFDILLLQDRAKSISPPHHLNFLSIKGFESLFKIAGFRDVSVWTPGELDVDIVLNSGFAPEFFKILGMRPGGTAGLQEFLKKHKLSSHVWAMGTK